MKDKVIVLHDDGKPLIIVKEKVEAIIDVEGIRDGMTSKCCVHLSGGAMLFADETYVEVANRYFS